MMLNSVSPSLPAQQAQQASAPAAANDAAPATATATAPADSAGAAPAPAQPFARWLGQQLDVAMPVAQAAVPAAPEADDGSTPAPSAAPVATDDKSTDAAKPTAAVPDSALLAAMAMPLMPLSPQQITQAVQAAQGGTHTATDDTAKTDTPAPALAVSGQDSRRAPAALPQALLVQALPPAGATAAPVADTHAAVAASVQANTANGNAAGGQDATADGAPAQGAQVVQTGTNVAASVPGAVAVQPAQPAADTVKLAGPPTAWRQSLQETLGDRLNVHVANNVQQATISIEPPQLGRIDIAIRHSAGTLEVNISASNGDVLRQLQTVSDNLRNDLSQRQYTEVAVTVTPTPKNNAAPFGEPQQQGRGRQQGRDQDNEPGRGLAEAGNPASVFNLGRES